MKFLKKHKKGLIILVIVLAAVTGLVLWLRSVGNKAIEAITAAATETAVAENRDLVSVVSATGKITSVKSKDVSSTASGVKIKEVYVSVGDEVKEGDVLLILDSDSLEKNLSNSKDSLEATKKSNNLSLSTAQRNYNDSVINGTISLDRIVEQIEEAHKNVDDEKNNKSYYENMYDDAVETSEKLETQLKSANAALSAAQIEVATASLYYESVSDNDPMDAAKNAVSAAQKKVVDAQASVASIQASVTASRANESQWLSQYTASEAKIKQYETTVETLEKNLADTKRSADSQIAMTEDSLASAKISTSTNTNSLETQISNFEDQIEACTLRAPFDGIVTSLNAEAGNIYTGMAAATIEDISSYEITTEIDEYDIGKIKKGQRVVIKTNGTGDTELEGTVKSVAPRATVSMAGASGVTYKVVISVDTKNDMLRLDMTAKLSIVLEESKQALTVPYDAVLSDDDGNKYVEVVDGRDNNGLLITHKVYVTTGIETAYYTEVFASDLKTGDEVKVERPLSDVFNFELMVNGPMGGM